MEDKGTEMKKGEGDKKEKNEEEEEDTVEAGEGGGNFTSPTRAPVKTRVRRAASPAPGTMSESQLALKPIEKEGVKEVKGTKSNRGKRAVEASRGGGK